MKVRLILIVLATFSNSVLSAEVFHKTKIDMVYPFKDGVIYVGIDTENEACKNGNEFYRIEAGYAGVSEDAVDRIYSAVLAAAAQQNQVEIVFEPNSNSHCYMSRLKVFY